MEREGEGNERSGLLIYFSDYSPHISSDLEVECSDLSVLKLSLPKGPRTFFHFVMVVFYILPLFPSLSSALWPKSVPAVLRAALLRARRLPLRVRGSARCCGRTGGGDLGRGQGKKKEKREKKSVVLFVCRVQTFSRRRGCCFARNSPRFFARHSSAGTFRTPCPVRGIRGGCAGSDPHPGLCHSCTTAGTGCRTTPPSPPGSLPFPFLFFPFLWQRGFVIITVPTAWGTRRDLPSLCPREGWRLPTHRSAAVFLFCPSPPPAVTDRKPGSPVGKSPDPLSPIHGLSIPASSS